jgi:ankyrin repeat protein
MSQFLHEDHDIIDLHKLDNIHEECKNQCRSSIILPYVELYPESLAKVDEDGCLPLHLVVSHKTSPDYLALKMIEKYPAALKCQNRHGNLPINYECVRQCRSSIILKCIELYPESLAQPNDEGYLPLHWLLGKSPHP